jgi:hypothetical protein
MQKAGTGWYFNLTNDLLITAGHQDIREVRQRFRLLPVLEGPNCVLNKPTPFNLARLIVPSTFGNTFAVKTHSGPTRAMRYLICAKIMKATYIYRDPRDVAVSAFDFARTQRGKGRSGGMARLQTMEDSIKFVRGRLAVWDRWIGCGRALVARYEDLMADPVNELGRLADFLSLDVRIEDLQRIVAGYERNGPKHHRSNLHFNQGIAGRFRSVMSQRELELCVAHFGEYLQRMGYAD